MAAYRGGYLPQDRREIERGLRDGSVRGLAATNALELGIDVSGLDAVVMAGWPGRRASLWQQAGRAGRSGEESLAVLVAADDPLDTYLVRHPEAIFGAAVEATVLDPHNPHVLAPHLAAAAAELPLGESDLPMFGPDARRLLDALVASGILRRRPSGWFWAREDRPAEHISLRGASDVVAVVEARTGRVLGTVDEASSHAQVHTGAVHVHQGDTWVVTELDLEARAAHVVRGDPGWSTHAQSVSRFDILGRERTERRARVEVSFGTVRVTSQVTGFLRRLPSGEVLGTHPLDLPERALTTKAVWWTVPDDVLAAAGVEPTVVPGALHAAEHAAIGMLPLVATSDRWDVGGSLDGVAPRHRPAHDHGVRRLPGRGGVRRARVRGVRGLGAGHPRRRARVPVRHGVPGLRAVAQVRQRQRAARQGRGGDRARAGPGAGRGLTRGADAHRSAGGPDPSATFDPVATGLFTRGSRRERLGTVENMVLLGVILVLLAAAAGVVLIVGTAQLEDTVQIDVLGGTLSIPPLTLLVTGMVVISVFWLGWALLRSSLRRSKRRRIEAKEATAAAEASRAEEQKRLQDEFAAREQALTEERRRREAAEARVADTPRGHDDDGHDDDGHRPGSGDDHECRHL